MGEVGCPGPVSVDPDPDPTLPLGDPGGGVQELVAQLLWFSGGQLPVQEHRLGPGEQVSGGQGELEPDGVDLEVAGGEPAVAGVLAGADAVLDPGVRAVAGFEGRRVVRPECWWRRSGTGNRGCR